MSYADFTLYTTYTVTFSIETPDDEKLLQQFEKDLEYFLLDHFAFDIDIAQVEDE